MRAIATSILPLLLAAAAIQATPVDNGIGARFVKRAEVAAVDSAAAAASDVAGEASASVASAVASASGAADASASDGKSVLLASTHPIEKDVLMLTAAPFHYRSRCC